MAPNLFSASLGKQVSLCQRQDKNISVCLVLSGPSRQEEEGCLPRHGPRVAAFLSGQRGLVGGGGPLRQVLCRVLKKQAFLHQAKVWGWAEGGGSNPASQGGVHLLQECRTCSLQTR